jgi:ribose/xylose/arabinose/galactoside ABC-type transport system permease subunit|tara:strand:+ start:4033 stop:5025 length:993 start_codon:yes stop_codon:yes gene_type:complete
MFKLINNFFSNHFLLFIFFVICLIGTFTSEYFFTVTNLQNMIRNMAVPGLLALGVSFVFLVSRIDLSVGSLTIFGPILAVSSLAFLGDIFDFKVLIKGNQYANSAMYLVIVSLITGIVVGVLNGVGVMYGKITSFIMTLAMMKALWGLNYVLTHGHAYYLQISTFTWMGTLNVFHIPFMTWVYVIMTIIAAFIMRYTIVGRRIYAIGGDEKTARLAGINVTFWIISAFVMSSFCASVAGLLFSSRLQTVDAPLAVGFELTAIAFAVVGGVSLTGGRGSPYRAFLGTIVMGALFSLFSMWGLNTWHRNIVVGIIIILVVMLDQRKNRFGRI